MNSQSKSQEQSIINYNQQQQQYSQQEQEVEWKLLYLKDNFEISGTIFSDTRFFILTEASLYQWENERIFQNNNNPMMIYNIMDYSLQNFRDHMIVLKHKNILTDVLMLYSEDRQKIHIWHSMMVQMQNGYNDFLRSLIQGYKVAPLLKSNLIGSAEYFMNLNQERSIQQRNQINQSECKSIKSIKSLKSINTIKSEQQFKQN